MPPEHLEVTKAKIQGSFGDIFSAMMLPKSDGMANVTCAQASDNTSASFQKAPADTNNRTSGAPYAQWACLWIVLPGGGLLHVLCYVPRALVMNSMLLCWFMGF